MSENTDLSDYVDVPDEEFEDELDDDVDYEPTDFSGQIDSALSPETFDFLNVLNSPVLTYAKDECVIYLDEERAYECSLIRLKLKDMALMRAKGEELEKVENILSELEKELDKSKYTFRLTGISTELAENLLASVRADKRWPIKYEMDPVSKERREKRVPERDRYFTNSLWKAHIIQIVAPSGAVDTNPSIEAIGAFRVQAPESQVKKLAKKIAGLTVAAKEFEDRIDEDFLAKS